MKANELNALTDEQLVHKGLGLERTLLTQTFRHRLGQLENTSVLGKTRRDIARVQTVVTVREHAQGLNKGALLGMHRSSFVPAVAASTPEAGAGFLEGMLDNQAATE